ncbi:hypothetical protein EJ05DRAFT_503069 [Pseudovirgaria hyperparasitica]|uniref:Uncharacterized protein n=1 Tax=Pseudovirgaria hyperparasitica TaxID=470096 RepID=A0A6A6W204_9PEZI|nr:uncharacterized protein EJ05DRAFT_503069 [Pseudovirgaria hyperparasitica]KAF2755607.1 hypothetical protein EJ05DRAFT_503069 [Pseudovirgaria hyperparasitica]
MSPQSITSAPLPSSTQIRSLLPTNTRHNLTKGVAVPTWLVDNTKLPGSKQQPFVLLRLRYDNTSLWTAEVGEVYKYITTAYLLLITILPDSSDLATQDQPSPNRLHRFYSLHIASEIWFIRIYDVWLSWIPGLSLLWLMPARSGVHRSPCTNDSNPGSSNPQTIQKEYTGALERGLVKQRVRGKGIRDIRKPYNGTKKERDTHFDTGEKA